MAVPTNVPVGVSRSTRGAAAREGCSPGVDPGSVGTSTGLNIAPGSDDDGWRVPDPVELSDGTIAQLYKDGEALHAAYNAIEAATRRICLEVYIFASDATGWAFCDLLCRKAMEGVKVYVVYDSFGSLRSDRAMFEKMRRSGIHLAEFHPMRPWETRYSWRPFNRDHRKLLVIDDNIAGLGGLNLGGEYAGSWIIPSLEARECDFWRDNAVGFSGPAARFFLHSFAATWHYVTHGGRITRAQYTHDLGIDDPPTKTDLGVLGSVPTLNSPLRPLLHKTLNHAKRSVQMTMAYFAPDDDLINTLCRAAMRGVKVQLMLPARCDVPLLIAAARSFYERLMTAGVEVYERQSVILHAKTMTIDGEITVIGSTNLDYRSIEYNCELSAIVRSRKFGRQMHDLFMNDVEFSKRIVPDEWRHRPWRDRVGQWMVSRARYLL